MKKTKGKVIEVFIPEEYIEGKLIDIMYRTQIGFKVQTEEGIKEIIEEQNEFNAEIMKDDIVVITEQIIDGIYFIDIELDDDEQYE